MYLKLFKVCGCVLLKTTNLQMFGSSVKITNTYVYVHGHVLSTIIGHFQEQSILWYRSKNTFDAFFFFFIQSFGVKEIINLNQVLTTLMPLPADCS